MDDDDESMRLVYDVVRVRDPNKSPERFACTTPVLGETFLRSSCTYYASLTCHGRIPIDFTRPWGGDGARTEPSTLPFEVIVYDVDMTIVSASDKRRFEDAKREFEEYAAKGNAIGLVHVACYGRGHPMLFEMDKPVTISEPVRIHVPSNDPEEEWRQIATLEIPTDVSDGGEDQAIPVAIDAKKRDRSDDKGKEEENDEDEHIEVVVNNENDSNEESSRTLRRGLEETSADRVRRADYIEAELRRIGIDHRSWVKNPKEFEKRCKNGIPSRLTKWTELFTNDAIRWAKELVELMTHACQTYDRVFRLTRTKDARIWINAQRDDHLVSTEGLIKFPSTFKCRCLKTLFTVVPESRHRPVLFHICDPIARTRVRLCSECMALSWMTSVSMLLLHSKSDPETVQYTDLEARCETRCATTWKLTDLASMYADHAHGIPIRLIQKAPSENNKKKKQRQARVVEEYEDSE